MKQLSKKEKFRLEKEREKRNKRLRFWSFIILFSIIFLYWAYDSIQNSPTFDNPEVDKSLVPEGVIHWHPRIEIIIEGENIVIPNNIGLAPGRHSPTHTHDEGDGTIHLENQNPRAQPETMTLGFFFNEWRQPFNETCILDKCITENSGELKMYINGEENFEFENYIFKGEEEILIEYKSEK